MSFLKFSIVVGVGLNDRVRKGGGIKRKRWEGVGGRVFEYFLEAKSERVMIGAEFGDRVIFHTVIKTCKQAEICGATEVSTSSLVNIGDYRIHNVHNTRVEEKITSLTLGI